MSGVILPKSFALLRKWPCHGLLALSWSCKRTLYVTKVRLNQPVSDLFTNPVDRLQPMVQIPIIPNSDMAFRPSRDEMEAASLMFERRNMKGETFQFLGSWPNPHIMPKWDVPEVAFIGKSNVGKSSLLAAMFAQVPDVKVKVSKKPGHTKLMNVFNVNNYFHLVDMPGYGFNMPDHFETSVEAYIKSRRNVMTFILFDGRVGVTNNDQKYFKSYAELKIPLCIVITKIDLARPATLIRSLMSVVKFRDETKADSCFPQPFLVSSVNGEGLAFLQSFIAYVTGNLQIKSLS
ncbi:GTP-binding protein 8-like isoform X2 [Physella acuta]|uniref:GTP-binding protein 8-like isoform X2 n=1 Tax=Physella acuta TaxID=109671 RepID=UPI0027DC7821|nr:GTP-binding protein 8-like isoform X2 [Physella acuta]